MRRSVLIGMLILVAGCAAAASNTSRGQGGASGAGGAGSSGSGSNQDGGSALSFGNGNLDGSLPSPSTTMDSGQCEAGTFCAPKSADGNCGTFTVKGDVKTVEKPGNVLLIFDRSGSMEQLWNGVAKWQAAGTAMVAALTPIQDKLTIGAVNFPGPVMAGGGTDAGTCNLITNIAACFGVAAGAGCNVNPITAPDQITFKPGAQAVIELQSGGAGGTPKYAPVAGGNTPTSEGVQQADTALRGATLTGTTAVVIITDGQPNCSWNQQLTTTTIGNWLSQLNVKTYVVGLPGAGGGVLDALAQAGGTTGAGGATNYITPADPATLQTKLGEIVSKTVSTSFDSCTVHLTPPAKAPEKLHMVVTSGGQQQDVPHMFPGQTQPAWTISKDGGTVDILGDLCTNVKKGTYESIGFVYGCVSLPPAPPPPGPS